ncbi:MAG: DUF371 domain-containing protein [Chloroflexi bacterium]|nr:DUF371 domain-containing protein [Chloroflexota bacterium]MCL5949308.1 DUF371 domain-containing protein [Candidatus Bathyarchaeota archaeon]
MSPKQTREIIQAFGHENIQAIHPTTLMFTKDKHLNQSGDCIIAVAADKAVADLSPEFKDKLKNPNAKLTILIEADGLKQQINASGSPKLILTHPTDMVIRKSGYICNRTLAINADKASNDLPREFTEKLKNPKQEVKITLIVES